MRAIPLALLLAACAAGGPREELPPPQLPQRAGVDETVAARAAGVEFHAVGDGFVLDIYREERIRLTLTEQNEEFLFAKPEPQYPRWNGVIYLTSIEHRWLSVKIRDDRPCRRAEAAQYPITVELRFDNREFEGCGRRF